MRVDSFTSKPGGIKTAGCVALIALVSVLLPAALTGHSEKYIFIMPGLLATALYLVLPRKKEIVFILAAYFIAILPYEQVLKLTLNFPLPIISYAVICLLFLSMALNGRRAMQRAGSRGGGALKWVDRIVFISLVYGAIYIPVSGNLVAGLHGYVYDFKWLIVYFVFRFTPFERLEVGVILGIMALNSLIVAVYGIYESNLGRFELIDFILDNSKYGEFPDLVNLRATLEDSGAGYRAFSLVFHYVPASYLAMLSFLVALPLFIKLKGISKILFALIAATSFMLLIYTQTISAIVMSALGAATIIVLTVRWRVSMLAGLAFVLAVTLFLAGSNVDYLSSISNRISDSAQGRDDNFNLHMAQALNYPGMMAASYSGGGVGSEGPIGQKYFPARMMASEMWSEGLELSFVENWYALVSLEMGIPFLVLHILFLFVFSAALYNAYSHGECDVERAIALGTLFAFIGMAAVGTVHQTWNQPPASEYMMALAGLLFSGRIREMGEPWQDPPG